MHKMFSVLMLTLLLTGCIPTTTPQPDAPQPQSPQPYVQQPFMSDPLLQGYYATILSGTVRTGQEIGREYCGTGIYLQADSGTEYLLKVRELEDWALFGETTLVGKKVSISGYIAGEDISYCAATMCSCELDFRTDGIKILE